MTQPPDYNYSGGFPGLRTPAPAPAPKRPVGLLVALILLVIAIGATTTVAFVQSQRLGDRRDEVIQLSDDLNRAQDELGDLRQELAEAQAQAQQAPPQLPVTPDAPDAPSLPDGLEDLEDLLGPDGLGGVGDLEDLLGSLDDLLGSGGTGLPDSVGPLDINGCLTGVRDIADVDGSTVPAQILDVQQAVQELRGLSFPNDVATQVLTSEQVSERIEALVTEDYSREAADIDRRIFASLQAFPADIDLIQTQIDLLGEQVAGFYDPDTGELVVRSDDPSQPLDATGLITVAHELEHALADAALGLPSLDTGDDEDAGYAGLAIVEGDAVALQTIFTSSALDPIALLGSLGGAAAGTEQLDAVPPYLADSLVWAYAAGPTRVCNAFGEGGWDAVNELVQNPPSTTLGVMHPELDGVAFADLHDPAGPEGWERAAQRTFGAAQLSWLLASPGGNRDAGLDDAFEVAADWRGGELTLWTEGADSALGVQLGDAGGLCDAMTRWWTAAAGGEELQVEAGLDEFAMSTADGSAVGVVACPDGEVHLGIGPTFDLASDTIHT